jgi:hypothetical protein
MDGKNFTLKEQDPPPCPGWISGVYTCTLIKPGMMRCTLKFSSGRSDHLDFYYKGN